MSATVRTAELVEVGAVAHVNFRVRCETLGHGEEVFLVAERKVSGMNSRCRWAVVVVGMGSDSAARWGLLGGG